MSTVDYLLDKVLTEVGAAAAEQEPSPLLTAALAAWIKDQTATENDAGTLAFLEKEPENEASVSAVVPSVPWAAQASYLLLIAPSGKVYEVDPRDDSVHIEAFEDISSQPCGTVTLTGSPARLLAGTPSVELVRARTNLLTSAALLGASRAAYVLTRDYVRTREQFGKPLVAIAAVASNLARMHVALLQADAALNRARELGSGSGTGSGGGSEAGTAASVAASVARATTAEAGTDVASLAHQLHGAIGITLDYPLQHLTRRIWALRDSFSPAANSVEEIGRMVLDGGETALWDIVTTPA